MIKFKSKRVNITPYIPSRLTGMSFNDKSYGIHSNLEINALVFKQANKHIFIISIDTLFVNNELKIIIKEEIERYFGTVLETDILIMSTHTHYAPSLEAQRIDLGVRDENYFPFLKNKIVELLKHLHLEDYSEIEIEVSIGKTEKLSCSRRRWVKQLGGNFKSFIAMEPNTKGFKNEEFRIIKIAEANNSNNILGVIWSFPCHLTNLYDKRLISAEYPGILRDLIREKQNKIDLPIIYMPGFAGDVRAYSPKRVSFFKLLRDIFQLSYPVKYYRFINKTEYEIWVNSVSINFWKIWNRSERLNDFKDSQLTSHINRKKITILGIKAEGIDDIIFRKVNFGNKLGFYTISAETVSAYSKLIENIATEDFYIYTGYTDEVFGYLPTQKQIDEGGYESNGYFKAFLITGNFNSSIEKTIELCIKEIK